MDCQSPGCTQEATGNVTLWTVEVGPDDFELCEEHIL